MAAVADMCELAHRQVPESTGHADGSFVGGGEGQQLAVLCRPAVMPLCYRNAQRRLNHGLRLFPKSHGVHPIIR